MNPGEHGSGLWGINDNLQKMDQVKAQQKAQYDRKKNELIGKRRKPGEGMSKIGAMALDKMRLDRNHADDLEAYDHFNYQQKANVDINLESANKRMTKGTT